MFFLFLASVDLKKALNWVQRKVLCWALRYLCVEERIVRGIHGMYSGARSRVRVDIRVGVGVLQGLFLSPFLFILVLEALYRCGKAWHKFKKLLPILTSRHLSFITWGRVYDACVRAAMLHGMRPGNPLQRICSGCDAMTAQ